MAIDSSNTIYIAGHGDHTIRKILRDGSVTTFAGANAAGSTNGALSSARFNYPHDVKIDKFGNMFVTDKDNHLIRKISSGIVSTYAGSVFGYADGVGTNAKFCLPYGLAIDSTGNVFVADTWNYLIRKIDTSATVTTISGTVAIGPSTNTVRGFADGELNESLYQEPRFIAVDANGTIYVSDFGSSTIRALYPNTLCNSGSALCVGQSFKCRTGMCVERFAGVGNSGSTNGNRLTVIKRP
jgi:sugar lactone lactonase YvrE